MSIRAFTRAVAVALAVALAACGGGGDTPPFDVSPDAVPRQVVTENVPLDANETIEAILVGGRGDYARLRMTAPGPSLDWNLHGHAGGGTQVIHEELKAMTVDYLFVPNDMADWYLLLRNKGQTDMTVQLTIDLYGAMSWSGWQ
jgi:hypothetical protein